MKTKRTVGDGDETVKGWKLIKDAPSEKTLAVVFCANTPEDECLADMWIGWVGGEDPWNYRVTHWMPVPGPPTEEMR